MPTAHIIPKYCCASFSPRRPVFVPWPRGRSRLRRGAHPAGPGLCRYPWSGGEVVNPRPWTQLHGVPRTTRSSNAGNALKPDVRYVGILLRPAKPVTARTHARTHRTYKPQGTRLTAEKGPRETLPRPLRPSVRLYRGAPAPLPSCSSGMKRWIDRWITKIRTQRSKRSYRTLSSLQFSTASTAAIVFYHELDSTSLRHHRQRTARTNDQSVQDARYNQLATKI